MVKYHCSLFLFLSVKNAVFMQSLLTLVALQYNMKLNLVNKKTGLAGFYINQIKRSVHQCGALNIKK
jgi:hypothetical protein